MSEGREITPVPPAIEAEIRACEELEPLRAHPAFQAFLKLLDDQRGINHHEILNCPDASAMLMAVGEGRALLKIRTLLDEKVRRGHELAREFDEAHAAYRARAATQQSAGFAGPPTGGPRRYRDSV